MEARNRIQPIQCMEAGLLAGLIAGIVMALVAMGRSASAGMSFWLPMQLIAGWFYGVDALIGGGWVVLVGIVIHLAVSAGYGLVFGLIAARIPAAGSFWAGIAYSVTIWVLMTYLVVPGLDPTMAQRVALVPAGWWFGYHLFYGATLTLASPFAQRFAQRAKTHVPTAGAQPA